MRSAIAETWADGDTGHGWDGYVARYEIVAPVSQADHAAALAFVDEALEPAGEDFVLAELARLRAMTVSRDVGQDLALVLAAYADELQRYPADAVREVLRGWGSKWWPAWNELRDQLDRLVRPRQALREAMRRGYEPPEAKDPRRPLTEEDRRKIDEILARCGFRFDDRGRVRSLEREPITKADRDRMKAELAEFRARWNANLAAMQADASEAAE